MHVTLVGAGALGRVYGLRLAATGVEVAFVVRQGRAGEVGPFVVEQVNGSRRRDRIERPAVTVDIPASTGFVFVAVRFDSLCEAGAEHEGNELSRILRAAPRVPIIVLTPLLPAQKSRVEMAIGRTVMPAMPGVVGYIDDRDVVRYWIPGLTATLIQDPGTSGTQSSARPVLEDLARVLTSAGLPARLDRDVLGCNAASTIAFFPLVAGIGVGGSVDGVLTDKALLDTILDAVKESEALAPKIGKVASWAHILMKFVGPFTLKPGVALARRISAEAVQFVERHFGPKLHDQHLAMGDAILTLGKDHGIPMPALLRLMSLLRAQSRQK